MPTVTVKQSHSTINVPSHSSYIVIGDDDTILVGADSTVSASGSALYVQVDGAGSVITIGGNSVAASNVNDNIVWFQNVAGTLHELANARTDVTANLSIFTMAGNDALGVYGSGDSVTANGANDSLWIGQNGFGVTGSALDFVSGLAHGSVYEMQGSSLSTAGSYDAVTLSAEDMLDASGLGLTVTVTAGEDSVTIGGNGVAASNANDNIVTFQTTTGTLNELANARTDVTADLVVFTMAANDALGVYGYGDSVTASGANDSIWIGQNGFEVTGRALDFVSSIAHGSVDVLQGSSVFTNGSYYSVTVAAQDFVEATGLGVRMTITGQGGNLTIGGNGAGASNLDDDVVLFQASGTISVTAGSRVGVTGSGSTVDLAGSDTLGFYGASDTVVADGTGDAIWIGQNGAGAGSAAMDFVDGLQSGSVYEMQGSTVTVGGFGYSVTMSGQDTLIATGGKVSVTGTGTGNTLTIGGNPNFQDTATAHISGAVINEVIDSSLVVTGADDTINASGDSILEMIGAGDHATIGPGTTMLVGQNGNPAAPVDIVSWSIFGSASITVFRESSVYLAGSTGLVTLEGDDVATIFGAGDQVTAALGGDRIAIGGNGQTATSSLADTVSLLSGDSVDELENSNVHVTAAEPNAGGDYNIAMGSDDALSIQSGMQVLVPLASGADVITGFGAGDQLSLAATFASVSALLAATTNDAGGATIHFDKAGDSVQLIGVSKATLTGYADAGLIKFA